MGRAFNDATSEHFHLTSALLTSTPLSIFAQFYTNDASAGQCILSISDASNANQQFALAYDGPGLVSTAKLIAMARDSGALQGAFSTATVSLNTWHRGLGVWNAINDRRVYLDGVRGTDDTVSQTPTGQDVTDIGRLGDSSPNWYWSGNIAEVAVWNVSLTDKDALQLEDYSPLLVKPQSLVHYYQMIRGKTSTGGGITDIIGGNDMADINTVTVVAHPRVIYPVQVQIAPFAAAAAGGRIMSSLAGLGGLAAPGGIAGQGGGLAG